MYSYSDNIVTPEIPMHCILIEWIVDFSLYKWFKRPNSEILSWSICKAKISHECAIGWVFNVIVSDEQISSSCEIIFTYIFEWTIERLTQLCPWRLLVMFLNQAQSTNLTCSCLFLCVFCVWKWACPQYSSIFIFSNRQQAAGFHQIMSSTTEQYSPEANTIDNHIHFFTYPKKKKKKKEKQHHTQDNL